MRSQLLDSMVEIHLLDTYLAWLFIAAIFFRVVGCWRYRKTRNTLELQKTVKLADAIVLVQAGILLVVCISLFTIYTLLPSAVNLRYFLFIPTQLSMIALYFLVKLLSWIRNQEEIKRFPSGASKPMNTTCNCK